MSNIHARGSDDSGCAWVSPTLSPDENTVWRCFACGQARTGKDIKANKAALCGTWVDLGLGPEPTTPLIDDTPQCITCQVELSSTLDAYHGFDMIKAAQCAPCRDGRRSIK